jgi:NAD(P)-dependent dehydrogenase (short-subunit alcohol dehydrogenase family)
MTRFADKVALVTGASSGIGRAAALAFEASQLAAGRSLSSRPDVTTNPNSKPERSGEPPSAGSVAFHVVQGYWCSSDAALTESA